MFTRLMEQARTRAGEIGRRIGRRVARNQALPSVIRRAGRSLLRRAGGGSGG